MNKAAFRRLLNGPLPALVLFLATLLAGLVSYQAFDSPTVDEPTERTSSIISYQELNRVLFNRETFTYIVNHPPIDQYRDRYYGVAMQLPTVLAEDLYHHFTGRDLSLRQVYSMRHLYTFWVYELGLICFYFLLKRLFVERLPAMVGILMIFLFGRYFAHSFFNIKDMIFASLTMMCLNSAEAMLSAPAHPPRLPSAVPVDDGAYPRIHPRVSNAGSSCGLQRLAACVFSLPSADRLCCVGVKSPVATGVKRAAASSGSCLRFGEQLAF